MNKLRSAVEHRSSLADTLFAEELYGVPHCFATGVDEMYHGTKSSIKDRLESCHPPSSKESNHRAIILETSPLIRKLSNISVVDFHEFSVVFYHHISSLATGFDRVDIIFDRYFENSLKRQTRIKRGSGGTRVLNINDDTCFPKNFQESFLHHPDNKNDLGLYLGSKLISLHRETGSCCLQLCVTYKDTILSTPILISQSLFPINSTSEEADQKIVRHTLHCINENYSDVVIHSIDYDVLILLLCYVAEQMEMGSFSVNVYFKLVTPNATWYDVVSLINEMGTDICKALPFFFAFTGCDTVPSFHGKGKCTIWDHWMKSGIKDDLTRTFIKIGRLPHSISSEDTKALETLVKLMYFGNTKNLNDSSLNQLRKTQFISSPSNDMRKIAPSSSALHMHTLQAIYQAGYLWTECITRSLLMGILKKCC